MYFVRVLNRDCDAKSKVMWRSRKWTKGKIAASSGRSNATHVTRNKVNARTVSIILEALRDRSHRINSYINTNSSFK